MRKNILNELCLRRDVAGTADEHSCSVLERGRQRRCVLLLYTDVCLQAS